MKNQISIAQASEILAVSEGTVKNWVKHKYLSPLQENGNLNFSYNKVKLLKKNILIGKVERLNGRANKINSQKSFIPKEYQYGVSDNTSIIAEYIINNRLEIDKSIFFLSINLLLKERLISNNSLKSFFTFAQLKCDNIFLLQILEGFYNGISDFSDKKKYRSLFDFELPEQRDVLGLLYQSIRSEGDKAKEGSYYTPQNIVNAIVSEYVTENSRVLDPCCGTGQFLLSVSNHIKNPTQIFGFDSDPVAVFISMVNLIVKYKPLKFNPKIFHVDTLLEFKNQTFISKNNIPLNFDLVITNPPWGLHFDKTIMILLKAFYPSIKSLESFSYFLSTSINSLKENGVISFVLPESILNIKVHSDIRREILERTSILKIVKLGRAFTNVFTNVIRIDLKKTIPPKNHKIKIVANSFYLIEQDRFNVNSDFIFDIEVTNKDKEIIEKVFQFNHSTLKDNAEWALGIVTGNNKEFIRTKEKDDFVYKLPYEKIYTGKNVNKYSLSSTENYIKFEPDKFQQVASIDKYRAKEKLIYKFISNKLVFAYDNKQRLTLNSANILIPKIKNYPIKMVLALLNSSLYQFLYFKKFNTIKVLRGNLEKLPFPNFSKKDSEKILSLINYVLQKKNDDDLLLNNFIMKLFEISESEKEYILKNIK